MPSELRVKRIPRTKAQLRSPWRLAISVLVLLAFTFQTFVLQTHVHSAASLKLAQAAGTLDPAGSSKTKVPANQDPSNCPICKEFVHSGSFIAPGAIAIAPPTVAISVILFTAERTIVAPPASHAWRGRAPPQH